MGEVDLECPLFSWQGAHASTNRGWWKDVQKLCNMFRGFVKCNIGDGSTVLFWYDLWNGNILESKYQDSTLLPEIRTSLLLSLCSSALIRAGLPRIPIQDLIQALHVYQISKDSWEYIWGSKNYSSSKCYNFPYKNIKTSTLFLWIWNSKCCNKPRVFSWLLLIDKLNTRNILRRKKAKASRKQLQLCYLQQQH